MANTNFIIIGTRIADGPYKNFGLPRTWGGKTGWHNAYTSAHIYKSQEQAERAIKRNGLSYCGAKYMTEEEFYEALRLIDEKTAISWNDALKKL